MLECDPFRVGFFFAFDRGWRSDAHASSLTHGYYLHPLRGFSDMLSVLLLWKTAVIERFLLA